MNSSDAKAIQDLFDKMKSQREQQLAANATNPHFGHMHESYPDRCRQWAKRDLWSLDEAANLLAGTDPERPDEIAGQEQLTKVIQTIKTWLKNSTIPTKGTLTKKYVAKEIIPWAREKQLPVPAPLLEAMGYPVPTKKLGDNTGKQPHGNTLTNAKKREEVLGAAIRALIEYPAQCKGRGGKYSGMSIALVIEQQQTKLFEGKVAHFTRKGMADMINKHLKPSENKS